MNKKVAGIIACTIAAGYALIVWGDFTAGRARLGHDLFGRSFIAERAEQPRIFWALLGFNVAITLAIAGSGLIALFAPGS